MNVRIKIAALWTSMLFVWAYVDIFSLYRPDFRADLEAGQIAEFTVNQSFLFATTAYVVIPSLMVFGALVLRPRVNRIANVALSAIYALTVIAGAIGEWSYYLLGSAIEIALLAAIVHYAWNWPIETLEGSSSERPAPRRTDVFQSATALDGRRSDGAARSTQGSILGRSAASRDEQDMATGCLKDVTNGG